MKESADWLEISVEVAGIDSELAADLLRQACPGGVVIAPAFRLDSAIDSYVVDGDAPALVRGYLPASNQTGRIRHSLRLVFSMAPLQTAPRWHRSRPVHEESWRDSWKKHFGILRIGRALVVKPSWVRYVRKGGETVIEIDPGMAFGTGQHQTTAMCLRSLEELVRPGMSVLDLGCGSGILSIAAAKLGATDVLALDLDPLAVKAARENAVANGVTHIVESREGTLSDKASTHDTFDIIAANISGLTLERLAPALASELSPTGVLIASGFLEDAVTGLSKAFTDAGLQVRRIDDDGVWRAIIAYRAP